MKIVTKMMFEYGEKSWMLSGNSILNACFNIFNDFDDIH